MWLVPRPGHSVPLRGNVVPDISRLLCLEFSRLMAPQQDWLHWLARQKTTRLKAHEGLQERILVQVEHSFSEI